MKGVRTRPGDSGMADDIMPQSGSSGSGGRLGWRPPWAKCVEQVVPSVAELSRVLFVPKALLLHNNLCESTFVGLSTCAQEDTRTRAAYSASEMSSPLEHRLAHEETSSVAQQKFTEDRDSTARTDKSPRQAASGSRTLRYSYASSTSSAGGLANWRASSPQSGAPALPLLFRLSEESKISTWPSTSTRPGDDCVEPWRCLKMSRAPRG
ncbi:hypothetical protein IWX49DRAFT_340430 [Phyllosticta citricarpa]|uniref:Uncharacterized protein n=2 Tax=Phyllosticta TaxID=121621 RepID=A0ABR1MTS3_9PEZI